MEYIIVLVVAFGASMLTFFSGFGLGTILTPAFVLFFPPEMAVAATALVHFINNLFKLVLIGKHAVRDIVLRFGLPAILGAYGGAQLLNYLSEIGTGDPIHTLGDLSTNTLNMILGGLIILFALMELVPFLKRLEFGKKWLIPGGVISGFFGGLSGHQGALRSAFLIKFPLTKEQFVGSGVVIACMIDIIRIGVYSVSFDFTAISDRYPLLIMATLAAFAGAILGKRLLKKMTIDLLQTMVGALMIVIGSLLILGVIS